MFAWIGSKKYVACLKRWIEICCWRIEFPPETEDAYNLQNLETSMYMRNKAAEKEASATAQQGDIEVTLNSKKRKASSTLDKKEKVCFTDRLILTWSKHYDFVWLQ